MPAFRLSSLQRLMLPALCLLWGLAPVAAQSDVALERLESRAVNRPLASLRAAVEAAKGRKPTPSAPREVPNYRGEGPNVASGGGANLPDAVLQTSQGTGTTTLGQGFPGANNNDNGRLLGYLVAPPDTVGEVGQNHFVQMLNSITTIYTKAGAKVEDSFPTNALWAGVGGNCEPYNQGDPIVLYDERANRWLVSQFAFPDSLTSFSQCVAISISEDPTGAYNRYEFSFNNIGFNDYPKHGIVSDSITMSANLFRKRGQFFNYGGTYLGVMDKNAMYAGQPASLIGFNIGTGEFGFVAGDLDGTGSSPALFATAMSQASRFDIWKLDVNWASQAASASRIASVPITPFDSDFCSASREACIPQPNNGPALETLSDRLMHRLQIRDNSTYRSMVTSHTVDVGNGRAGIRWYELRESNGTWSLYQEGTFGPNDGKHRWMPSAAKNLAGDLAIGYMVSSANTFVSTAVAGQSAASAGSGFLDSAEQICAVGSAVQTGTGRAGDYSATSVDPFDDSFWHTNEVFTTGGNFQWDTFVCKFRVGSGGGAPNTPPTASFTYSCNNLSCSFNAGASTDSDGTIQSYAWNFGDGTSGSGVTVNKSYAAAGTYSVVLTVTDDDNATNSATQSVTVIAPAGTISLTAVAVKVQGRNAADLAWSGATGTSVDVFRNGAKITTTPNDGAYRDNTGQRGAATYTYKVCEAGTSNCSNVATVVF